MKELKGACIIGQSGGPTSVINASAYGVIDTALKSGVITQVLGAEHGIKGVLADVACCVREQLLNGNKVQLEGLGTFGITLNSQGAESLKAFTSDNIKKINIVYTPDAELENLIDDAAFDLVASRAAQAATLKAEKAGEGTVDLDAAKKKGTQSTDAPQV